MRAEIHCSAHRLRFRLVGEPESELPVDLGLVGRVGVAEHGGDVAERGHQGRDFCSAHPARGDARVRVQICFRAGAFGLGLVRSRARKAATPDTTTAVTTATPASIDQIESLMSQNPIHHGCHHHVDLQQFPVKNQVR
ncbi:hypothetical protein [Micromonospora psammae]|uniref:hypothetical protein n=1 Tax=Micromonospora sp. CPCC 205556 TaxID=3122398 RepID=UPI002FF22C5E